MMTLNKSNIKSDIIFSIVLTFFIFLLYQFYDSLINTIMSYQIKLRDSIVNKNTMIIMEEEENLAENYSIQNKILILENKTINKYSYCTETPQYLSFNKSQTMIYSPTIHYTEQSSSLNDTILLSKQEIISLIKWSGISKQELIEIITSWQE